MDLFRSNGGHESDYVLDDHDVDEAKNYQDDQWWDDEAYHAERAGDDETLVDDDVPKDVGIAVEEMEDAYINYVHFGRRMKGIAFSRRFFPVVAVPPSDFGAKFEKFYGKGGDKGGFRKFAFPRRPISVLRRDAASNNPMPSSDSMRSSGSCSTAGHGPRFKHHRLQDVSTKQANEALMVEEVPNHNAISEKIFPEEASQFNINAGNHAENVFFNEVRPGFAIVDSSATKSVIGGGLEEVASASRSSQNQDFGQEGDQRFRIW